MRVEKCDLNKRILLALGFTEVNLYSMHVECIGTQSPKQTDPLIAFLTRLNGFDQHIHGEVPLQ